jgi:hypothetical protein
MAQVESLLVYIDFYMTFLCCAPAVILMGFLLFGENLPTVGTVTPKIVPHFVIERKYAECIALEVFMSLTGTIDLTA